MERPRIKFLQGESTEMCEAAVNSWIENLPFEACVLNINVIPMMLEGKFVFLAIVCYTAKEAFHSNTIG